MIISRSGLFSLLAFLMCFPYFSSSLYGQREQPLLLSDSGSGQLMLGAIDRLVIPSNGRWQVVMAPDNVLFSPGAWLLDGGRFFAGTNGLGLYQNSSSFKENSDSVTEREPGSFLDQKSGLAGNIVTAIEKVGSNLWVGTDGGLSLIEAGKVVSFSQWNSALPGGPVSNLLGEPSGNSVWVVTREGGALVSLDLSVVPWSKRGTPPVPGQIMDLAIWNNGSLIVAGINSLYSFQTEWSKIDLDFTAVSLLWIPSKGLIMGTVKGLFILEGPDSNPKQVFTKDKITSMALSGDSLWVTTDDGVRVAGSVKFLPDILVSSGLVGEETSETLIGGARAIPLAGEN